MEIYTTIYSIEVKYEEKFNGDYFLNEIYSDLDIAIQKMKKLQKYFNVKLEIYRREAIIKDYE